MESIRPVFDTIAHYTGETFPLAITVALGAIAVSGKFYVRATQILLVIAWSIFLLGLREQTPVVFGINAIISAIILGLLAVFFRPDTVPQYFGSLIPGRRPLLSPRNRNPVMEIGDGGTIFVWGSREGGVMLQMFDDSELIIELIRGRIYVSTKIKDENGNLLVELVRNTWRVGPSPTTWDRNYNRNALEVKDPAGNIVLQVKAVHDRIQLQCEWKHKNSGAVRFVKHPDGGALMVIRPDGVFSEDDPKIQPIFEYPSDTNLGKLKAA